PTTPQQPLQPGSSPPTAPLATEPVAASDDPGVTEPGAEPALPLEGALPAPTAAEFSVTPPDQVIATFIDLGQALLRMQRLQLPPEANATLFFARVLVLDPGNETARAGLSSVVDAYLALSDADLDAGRVAEGKERLDRARQVAATPGLDNAALLTRIDARWNQRVASLREAARGALAAWRGSEAERAIVQALTLVPGDKELTQWLAEAKVIGKPGYRFRDSAQAPELVIVGGGSAMLGGVRSGEVRVDIKQPFAVARKETSVADFRRFVEASKHAVARESCHDGDGGFILFSGSKSRTWLEPGFAQGGDHPVVCVSFDDASAYAGWLSQTTGKKYRLLSEAEWQYLARQVKPRPCATGNRADQSHKKAEGGSKVLNCDDGFAMTAPVGRFEASAPGIYDIEGNVREWVADCANDSHVGRPADQSARNSGGCGERMIMGSAWHSDSGEPAVIARRPEARKWRSNAVGFRVAREMEPVAAAPR
ncbi:MAG TPA: SUMF1/EgtB/PvdO family nonheme iron enzyme, partial [Xanthomonadales bacterium]|nr:SUMF1/EgtB/PvdO family nonheme iron enzyme [Xanthomonadales bacterium]